MFVHKIIGIQKPIVIKNDWSMRKIMSVNVILYIIHLSKKDGYGTT